MLLRIMLLEKLSVDSLGVVWKFPSATEDEELLVARIEFLWREASSRYAKTLRTLKVWQLVHFGTDFAIVLEKDTEPASLDFTLLAKLVFKYEKSRDVTTLAEDFLDPLTAPGVPDVPLTVKTTTELLDLLRSFKDNQQAARLWWLLPGHRTLLYNGISGDLLNAGRLLSFYGGNELYPLFLGVGTPEADQILDIGSCVCCCPSLETDNFGLINDYWDAIVDFKERKIGLRKSIENTETLGLAKLIEECMDDQDFTARAIL